MGLTLPNPIIAGSCSLHKTAEGVKRSADAGAGAVVLKSLFEEELEVETSALREGSSFFGHTEAYEYVNKLAMKLGPRDYLALIEKCKKAVSVPVIASLNCVSAKWWVDYASQMEAAGADALEINAAIMPTNPEKTSEEIEKVYYDVVESLREKVSVPFAIKIGPYFTSLSRFASGLAARGASGLVLFNRFYQFDIDPEKMEIAPGYRFSSPDEIHLPLRWIAILAGRVGCDLAASTGVHDAAGAVKQLLAGAAAVQVCSTLYLHRQSRIGALLDGLKEWMQTHGFCTLDEFRGKLSREASADREAYERLQYIKVFVGIE